MWHCSWSGHWPEAGRRRREPAAAGRVSDAGSAVEELRTSDTWCNWMYYGGASTFAVLSKSERADIAAFETEIEKLLAGLSKDNIGLAIAIAKLPMDVRGFGPVKGAQRASMLMRRAALWTKWPGKTAQIAA